MKLTKGDSYFYVYRDTYDAAVVLSNRYNATNLELKVNVIQDKTNVGAYERLQEILPEPIDILAPFILLVTDELNAEDNDEELCGVLSAVTEYIDPVKFVATDTAIRKSATYTEAITKEYQMSWQKFMTMAVKQEDIDELLKPAEIHSKVEQQLAMPVYVMAPGQMMGGQSYQQYQQYQPPIEEKVTESTAEFSDDGQTIFIDPDEDVDFSELEEMLAKEEAEKKTGSKSSETSEATSSARYVDDGPQLDATDQAGFNPVEDRDKAEQLLGIKHKSDGVSGWEV